MADLVEIVGIGFEPRAFRRKGEVGKALFSRDESSRELRSRGYERHPYAHEYFSALIASLEGKLSPKQQNVIDDKHESYGEWFHDVLFVNDTHLTFFEGVESLSQNHEELKYTKKTSFKLNTLKPETYYTIQDIFTANKKLGKHLWTREYHKLPQEIQQESGLYLPSQNQVLPVGRGNYVSNYVVDGSNYSGRASRGVVVGTKKNRQQTKT